MVSDLSFWAAGRRSGHLLPVGVHTGNWKAGSRACLRLFFIRCGAGGGLGVVRDVLHQITGLTVESLT